MKIKLILGLVLHCVLGYAQVFEGTVILEGIDSRVEGAVVSILEDDVSDITDANGDFSITATNSNPKTLVVEYNGYLVEQKVNLEAQTGISFELRAKQQSTASVRMEGYVQNGCNTVSIPADLDWRAVFTQSDLTGDLAPNNTYTRRDPSSVIQVDTTYYVWYSYSLTFDNTKDAPWDKNDLYYATSTDGYNWTEQGVAIARGEAGSHDARSAFTTEVFVHEGTYYLIYQAAADLEGIYNRNTVAMAYASSPDGPWTKLDDPILHPTYTDSLWFDNNAVHDPCVVYFNNKFYLYYKGECNCMGAAGCQSWCNPVCGTNYGSFEKQVKWGVAISDNPTGPYVKSEYNPITNTGHEVSVWNYETGIAILQHQDGPEGMTVQYAEDGLNFEIKGSISGFPEAPGLFRHNIPITEPTQGVGWGLCHVLNWNAGPNGWMNLRRFDLEGYVPPTSMEGIQTTTAPLNVVVYPNPTGDNLTIKGVKNGQYKANVYTIYGVEILSSRLDYQDGAILNIATLSEGQYILQLIGDEGSESITFNKINM